MYEKSSVTILGIGFLSIFSIPNKSIAAFSEISDSFFELMVDGDKDPELIVEQKGLKQESDPKELEKLIDKIINKNLDKVKEYKSGKEKLFGFFVGQVMKVSGGKANPKLANEILKDKLSK